MADNVVTKSYTIKFIHAINIESRVRELKETAGIDVSASDVVRAALDEYFTSHPQPAQPTIYPTHPE